ncbi:MAG: glutamate--tRNA ligase family protein [Gemmatimonadales bacterium]
MSTLSGPLPRFRATRFAPSPTGYLHLGHVVNAVWVWGLAQASGARVLLRLEDHDRGRCRPEYERAIFEDLDWLGLEPEPESRESLEGGGLSSYRQSDNSPLYQAALVRLAAMARVYGCRCSRSTIARALRDEGWEEWDELRYPGTCRGLGIPPGEGVGIRAMLPPGAVEFDDLRTGPVRQVPAEQCGDLLVRDATGSWTYQFCVTVDDLRHDVDLVIRGEDLLESAGRQILLATLLGRPAAPRFLHHPLVLNERGVKLSKRDGAAGVRELRAAGRCPEEVLGLAAWRSGLLSEERPLRPGQLGELFGERGTGNGER